MKQLEDRPAQTARLGWVGSAKVALVAGQVVLSLLAAVLAGFLLFRGDACYEDCNFQVLVASLFVYWACLVALLVAEVGALRSHRARGAWGLLLPVVGMLLVIAGYFALYAISVYAVPAPG